MSALGYYIALPFIYFFAVLPFPLLHAFSDGLYFLLYYVLGYRKKVVMQNLRSSFPEKSEEEIKQITIKFYRHFCDVILETLKLLTMSRKDLVKRCTFHPEARAIFEKYYSENKSIVIVLGHLGNWEWGAPAFCQQNNHPLFGLYHPLRNTYFNRFVYRMRSRHGTNLVAMKEVARVMLGNAGKVTATALIADQTPPPESAYWMQFLNQDTPVFQGTEKMARKFNYPVIFTTIKRVRRGYYSVFAEVLAESPKDLPEGTITERHTRKLEKEIMLQPETWLWSHRRWKHKRPAANH